MITRGFVEKIRSLFDEFEIKADKGITYDEFYKIFINKLNHSNELQDASLAINIFRYCDKKWNKIEKMFSNHLDLWQEYKYEGPSNMENIT